MNPIHIKAWVEIVQGLITACASIVGAFLGLDQICS